MISIITDSIFEHIEAVCTLTKKEAEIFKQKIQHLNNKIDISVKLLLPLMTC